MRLTVLELRDGKGQGERRLADEAVRIGTALSGFRRQVLLDSAGAQRDSEGFASWLASRMSMGESLAFAIGSSDGFHPALKTEARERMSLSAMTFPHDLCRVIFLEQLYRAFCILKGKQYHK